MKKMKNILKDDYISLALMTLLLSVSAIRMSISMVLEKEFLNDIVKYVLIFLTLLFLLKNLHQLIKPIIVVGLVLSFFGAQYILLPDNAIYMASLLGEIWIYLVMTFLCGYLIKYKNLEKSFKYASIIVFVCGLALLSSENYYKWLTDYEYGGVGAVFSSLIFIPAVVFAFVYKDSKNWWFLIASFICAMIMTFIGGKRMTAVCYFFTICYTVFCGISKQKRIALLMSSMLLLFLTIVFFPLIISFVDNNMGFNLESSRFFNIIDSFSSSSSRTEIRSELYDKVLSIQGVILGYGLMGDNVITKNHMYAHNIFLEIIIEFGLILGSLIILSLFLIVLKTYRRKTEYNKIIMMLMFLGIMPLLQSGVCWASQFFWLLLSICMHVLTYDKSTDKEGQRCYVVCKE